VTADTGIDALTHAIECYVGTKSTIVSEMFSEAAIKLISENLRLVYAKGSKNIEARYKMSVAATLAAGAIQVAAAGLTHTMDGLVVEKVHISHGAALGILLPHVMEFNLVAAPAKFVRIAELMGEKTDGLSVMDAARKAVAAVRELCKDIEMAQRLSAVGISDADIPQLVDDFVAQWIGFANVINPRDVSRKDAERIFKAAL